MKKTILSVALMIIGYTATAQVGIGTTPPQATLDITGKPATVSAMDGIIAPRITAAQLSAKTYAAAQNGAMVYVTDATPGSAQANLVSGQGLYTFDGTAGILKWIKAGVAAPKNFIYMPSVAINVSVNATGATLDLYSVYATQFTTPTKASAGAPAAIPVLTASDFYYYVTYADPTVFSITSITAAGLMTYNVTASGVSDASFINVVLVPKN